MRMVPVSGCLCYHGASVAAGALFALILLEVRRSVPQQAADVPLTGRPPSPGCAGRRALLLPPAAHSF